ncbi:MAG: cell division protein ZapA [Prevotellaceae bacterium]|jgi:cell division protein ZapA (FtsZ GTPase activity inhibitor)|nr:cell division protein ZapA [Prevotellaceae bacterium]
MDDTISIKITVADRPYPLRQPAAKEERIRSAAGHVNDRVMQYQQRYVQQDAQDALAITALQYMMKIMDYEEITGVFVQEMQQLDKQLEDYLRKVAD